MEENKFQIPKNVATTSESKLGECDDAGDDEGIPASTKISVPVMSTKSTKSKPIVMSSQISKPGHPTGKISSDVQVNFEVNMDNLPGPDSDEEEGYDNFEPRSNVKFDLGDVADKLSQLNFGTNFDQGSIPTGSGLSNLPPSSSVPCNTMLSDSDDDGEIEGADILKD